MDAATGMQIMDRMLDLHNHLVNFGIEVGSEGYYLTCYCGDGASGQEIAKCLGQAVPVEVKVVGSSQGNELLGVFLASPPRQLHTSEVRQHVIWGKLAELKVEFGDYLE